MELNMFKNETKFYYLLLLIIGIMILNQNIILGTFVLLCLSDDVRLFLYNFYMAIEKGYCFSLNLCIGFVISILN